MEKPFTPMTEAEYHILCKEQGASQLVRPFWTGEEYHRKLWDDMDLTVLICQRKTREITQLCLESLLHFYPNVNILVVDGNSQDASTLYLRFMALKYPNVKVWERAGINSHGETMHEAILDHITTEYVLLMDSDVITMRYGMIEGMLSQFDSNKKMYATGNTMLVTRKNDACGCPEDASDAMRYAHPCLSIYHVPTYKTLERFVDHGAPCCYNMEDAEKNGYEIGFFPADLYTAHLSGSSWQQVCSVWNDDNDIFSRPLITFVLTNGSQAESLEKQKDKDFNMVTIGAVVDKMVAIHQIPEPHIHVQNALYNMRFKVSGHYVCVLTKWIEGFGDHFVRKVKLAIIEGNLPEEIVVDDIRFVERKKWQRFDAIESK